MLLLVPNVNVDYQTEHFEHHQHQLQVLDLFQYQLRSPQEIRQKQMQLYRHLLLL